jgi:parallel beta-helix repeat protein
MTVRIVDRATGAIVGILALFVIAVLTGVVNAGPLDPGGSPGSTPGVRRPGTPIETLPFTINNSGHYYLTGNLIGLPGNHGITINSGNVTIDLGGFTMTGPAGSFSGVFVNNPSPNVTLRNGAIVEWDGIGIDVSNTSNAVLEDIQVLASGGVGIGADFGAKVSRCTVANSGNSGVVAGSESVISDCVLRDNGGQGLVAGEHSVIARVTASGNANGFDLSGYSMVTDCTASQNDGFGIHVGEGSVVENCTAHSNGGDGIEGSSPGVVIRDSTATENGGNGLVIGVAGVVEASTAQSNTAAGIRTEFGGVIRGNTARFNHGHGIHVGSSALVETNQLQSNGVTSGSGVLADGNANHIEGNLAVDNDVGFNIVGGFNTVIGNTARSNGAGGITDEYVLLASNVAGPILDGATVDDTTNPYANFAP